MNTKSLVAVAVFMSAASQCLAGPALIVPDIMAVGQTTLVAPQIAAVGQAVPQPQNAPSQEIVVQQPSTATPAEQPAPTSVYRSGSRRLRVGPELGLFIPTTNLVRNRFGNDWFSVGIGLGQYAAAPVTGQWSFDIGLISNTSGSNAAYLLPLGPEYRIGLTRGRSVTPYLAAEGDIVPTDIRSETDNVPYGIRTSWGGGAFGGLDFGNGIARIEGGYRWFTQVAGYTFSGAEVSLGLRF